MHMQCIFFLQAAQCSYFFLYFQGFLFFIAPAYSRVRYRSSNFRPSVRSFVRPCVRSSVRPSTFTSKFSFLDIRDSCESKTLHSNCS